MTGYERYLRVYPLYVQCIITSTIIILYLVLYSHGQVNGCRKSYLMCIYSKNYNMSLKVKLQKGQPSIFRIQKRVYPSKRQYVIIFRIVIIQSKWYMCYVFAESCFYFYEYSKYQRIACWQLLCNILCARVNQNESLMYPFNAIFEKNSEVIF